MEREDGGEGGGHTKYSPCAYLASRVRKTWWGEMEGRGRTHIVFSMYLVEQYTKCFEGLVSVDK